MNLFSTVNINDDHKEHKALKASERATGKRDYGYSVYQALEYGKNNQQHNSLGLHMEIMKSFVR